MTRGDTADLAAGAGAAAASCSVCDWGAPAALGKGRVLVLRSTVKDQATAQREVFPCASSWRNAHPCSLSFNLGQ